MEPAHPAVESPKRDIRWFPTFDTRDDPVDNNFPNGQDVDESKGAANTCVVELPYQKDTGGYHRIDCHSCMKTTIVTVSGRADDARSVRIACNYVSPEPKDESSELVS